MLIHDTSLFFIAADRESYEYVQSLKGQCLFYGTLPLVQTLSFCYQQEVWVLYATPRHYSRAVQLGRQVQLTGSRKILLVCIQQ